MWIFRGIIFLGGIIGSGAFITPSDKLVKTDSLVAKQELFYLKQKGPNQHSNVKLGTDDTSTLTFLKSQSSDSDNQVQNESSFFGFNPLFFSLWAVFVSYLAIFSPGEMLSTGDTQLIEAYIADPIAPENFNSIYYVIFGYLGIVPLMMSCLIYPSASKNGLPALPFILASFGLGFGAIGPYLAFRAPTQNDATQIGWFTRMILENKFFNASVLFLLVSTIGASGLIEQDFGTALEEFLHLFSTSKLVSVSSADLSILTLAMASLVTTDFKLRAQSQDTDEEASINARAYLIGLSTLLLPVFGSALYLMLRPPLQMEE